eukprot:364510-Chlamydomonas_euryale.AAC.8
MCAQGCQDMGNTWAHIGNKGAHPIMGTHRAHRRRTRHGRTCAHRVVYLSSPGGGRVWAGRQLACLAFAQMK